MENITEDNENKPLGYWLRAIDELLNREFAAAFAAEGVTRRDWMLLNVLDGSVDAPGLAERIQRGKKLRTLRDRGWVVEQDGTWMLTEEGRGAKERLAGMAENVRAKATGAVSPEDFGILMTSLEAIAKGLGWEEGMPMGRGHKGPRGHRGHRGHGFGPGARHGHGFGPHSAHGDGPCHHGHGDRHSHHGHGGHHSHNRHGGHHHRAAEHAYGAGFARPQA